MALGDRCHFPLTRDLHGTCKFWGKGSVKNEVNSLLVALLIFPVGSLTP